MWSEEVTGSGTIQYSEQEIPYTVIYSNRRKSWAIEVKTDAAVIVRMPQHIPPENVRKLVETKAGWIASQVQKYTEQPKVSRSYTDGETLPFFGDEYPVARNTGSPAKAEFLNNRFVINIPDDFSPEDQTNIARDMIIMLYRRIGTAPLEEIISRYVPLTDVEPTQLRIRLQERKWGCCTPKNGIIINARVLLAPRIVAEYIVVHELAHLRFRHHQRTFWNEVARLMPTYRDAEKILKTDGRKFVF